MPFIFKSFFRYSRIKEAGNIISHLRTGGSWRKDMVNEVDGMEQLIRGIIDLSKADTKKFHKKKGLDIRYSQVYFFK